MKVCVCLGFEYIGKKENSSRFGGDDVWVKVRTGHILLRMKLDKNKIQQSWQFLHQWQLAKKSWVNKKQKQHYLGYGDMPPLIITTNADRIPLSASSFSSSVSSSCRTPKMYVPYTSWSTSNDSKRSFNQLSNSPVSVMGAAILALWGLSMIQGCPLLMPVKKKRTVDKTDITYSHWRILGKMPGLIFFKLLFLSKMAVFEKRVVTIPKTPYPHDCTKQLITSQFTSAIVIHI